MPNYTRTPERELPLNPRLPLLGIPNQRAGDPDIDSRLVNAYAEQGTDQRWHISKRPGLVVYSNPPGAARIGLGLCVAASNIASFWQEGTVGAYYESLYSGVTSVNLGTVATRTQLRHFHAIEVYTAAETTATLATDGQHSYLIDDFAAATALPEQDSTFNATVTTNGTAIVTHDGTVTFHKYSRITGADIPADTEIASIDSSTQFTMTQAATGSSVASRAFTRSGPPFSQYSSWPAQLNRSVYMAGFPQTIQGSDIDDPTAWDWLNIIYAYATTDLVVGLFAQLSTILAFKTASVEAFRDAGLTPTPLARVEGFRLDVGLLDANTIREADGTILWVSNQNSGQRGVWKMNNLRPEEVSNPAIRRILNEYSGDMHAMTFAWDGHTFYLVALEGQPAIVYDLTAGLWYLWTALGDVEWPFVDAVAAFSGTYFQHRTNGKIYNFSATVGTDDGQAIYMDIYPPKFDGGTHLTKYVSRMYIACDQQDGSEMLLRVSDDGQKTWTEFRRFDLSHSRPFLESCGSFTTRHFHFRHYAPTPCRVNEVELAMEVGVL